MYLLLVLLSPIQSTPASVPNQTRDSSVDDTSYILVVAPPRPSLAVRLVFQIQAQTSSSSSERSGWKGGNRKVLMAPFQMILVKFLARYLKVALTVVGPQIQLFASNKVYSRLMLFLSRAHMCVSIDHLSCRIISKLCTAGRESEREIKTRIAIGIFHDARRIRQGGFRRTIYPDPEFLFLHFVLRENSRKIGIGFRCIGYVL
jgi:hypothetical protein